jgi:hypothetical protein
MREVGFEFLGFTSSVLDLEVDMEDSYADRVRRETVHAPVAPTRSKGVREMEQHLQNEAVEPN